MNITHRSTYTRETTQLPNPFKIKQDWHCTYNATRVRSRNHYCRGKAVTIKYDDRVSVFLPSLSVRKIASLLRCIILPSVACLAIPYFPTLSPKKGIEDEMCALIFSTPFFLKISHSMKNSAKYCHSCTNVFMYSTRYSCPVVKKLEFSQQKNSQILNFMKIRQWKQNCFMWAGRHYEADKPLFAVLRTPLRTVNFGAYFLQMSLFITLIHHFKRR